LNLSEDYEFNAILSVVTQPGVDGDRRPQCHLEFLRRELKATKPILIPNGLTMTQLTDKPRRLGEGMDNPLRREK
jgi:hypothetical protein